MKHLQSIIHKLAVISCVVPYTLAVINVTLTGTTTRHVCKGEKVDFKWTYDDTDPDKNFIKTIQWSKDPSGDLIMQYETSKSNLSITSSPNDYTERVERTNEAGSNDIGMRLKTAGSNLDGDDVDDDGKYYVSLIVDKDPGDADDYFVPYRDPQGVQVYVCVGVDDSRPIPSLSLTYDETTHIITCSGPFSLGDTTFAIFDPSMNNVVNSTTNTTISMDITANRPGGNYTCKTYCTQQGYDDTPQGTCLPTDATLIMPAWSSWGNWTECTPGASQNRTRDCNNPPPAGTGPQNCPGSDTETKLCPTPPPTPPPLVNGSWSDWGNWTTCSVSCDNGTQTRNRECDNPPPSNGGENCTGEYYEIRECLEGNCPVNGSWSDWGNWTPCSESCDNGTQTRNRECDDPAPEYGGENCIGDYEEVIECLVKPCPVNGSWGSWAEWGECPVDCGISIRTRSRVCNDPAPANDGKPCPGSDGDQEECATPFCISSISPLFGPEFGGTSISVYGSLGLFSLVDIELYIGNLTCALQKHDQSVAVFTNPAYETHGEGASKDQAIMITIGDGFTETWNVSFTYLVDPSVSGVTPGTCDTRIETIQTVTGRNFDSVAQPKMAVSGEHIIDCDVVNSSTMTCPCPPSSIIRNKRDTLVQSAELFTTTISFILDGIVLSDIANLTYYATVELEIFQSNYELSNDDNVIIIKGSNLAEGLLTSDYTVKIDKYICTDVQVTADEIQCTLSDDIRDALRGTSAPVVVKVGENVEFKVGSVDIPAAESGPPEISNTTIAAIIGGVIGGLVLIAVIIIILVALMKRRQRKPTSSKQQYNNDFYAQPAQYEQQGRDAYIHRRSPYGGDRPQTWSVNRQEYTRPQAPWSVIGNERDNNTNSFYYSRGLAFNNSYQNNRMPNYDMY